MGDTYSWNYSITRENGRFRDADLARILQNATEASAGAFKARGTPEVLRVVELLSIEQGRVWGVCTVSRHAPFCTFHRSQPYPAALVERVPQVHGIETWAPRFSLCTVM